MGRTVGKQKALAMQLHSVLRDRLGHQSFRENQEAAITAACNGRDCLVLANTGAGKTLCFVVPGLLGRGLVLVVSPLIALMQNQVEALKRKGVKAELLCSAQSSGDRGAVIAAMRADPCTLELVFTTPESLHTEQMSGLLSTLHDRRAIALVAVDEAHCISSWGHDFRPAYRKLGSLAQKLPQIPIMALTATATQQVQDDILRSLHLRSPVILRSSFNRPNIFYAVRYLDEEGDGMEDKLADLSQTLQRLKADLMEDSDNGTSAARQHSAPSAVIYARKRRTTELIAQFLSGEGLPAAAYHAGLRDAQRSQVLVDWTSGRTPIVAATIAFGMGIDKADVRMVAHFNLPKSLEAFYQESGRAGRDGRPSFSVLYFGEKDAATTRWLLSKERGKKRRGNTSGSSEASDRSQQAFNRVEQMATGAGCRREAILRHFGERIAATPGRSSTCCDYCKDPEGVKAQQMAARARETLQGGWSGRLPTRVNGKEEDWDAEEREEGGEKRHKGEGFGVGSSEEDEDDEDGPGSSIAKEVVQQAKTAGADVFDALLSAERMYAEPQAAKPKRPAAGSRVLERLGSGGSDPSDKPSQILKPIRKTGSLQLGELRKIATAQIARNLKENPNLLGDLLETQLNKVAAAMEEEQYHASASKPVYKSHITTAKRNAKQGSAEELEKYMPAVVSDVAVAASCDAL